MTHDQTLLEVRDLGVAYGGAIALSRVSLDVRPGETVALLGANGAGKTTLLRALSGLVPKIGGSVTFGGEDITRAKSHDIVGKRLIQVPEHRLALGRMSVLENIMVGAHVRKGDPSVAEDLQALLARFPDLKPRLNELAGGLSGGQQQMLVICRGLIAKPRLLMLDEPSLGLAPIMVERLYEVLADLRRSGQSILLVEQNARKALSVSDRAFVLELGKIALHGDSGALASDPRVASLYLGGEVAAAIPA